MLDLILLDFTWSQLLQPQFYIDNGGLWLVLFIIFAETGLFAGFFYQVIPYYLLPVFLVHNWQLLFMIREAIL